MEGDGVGAGQDGSTRRRIFCGDDDGGGATKKRFRKSGSGGARGSSSDACANARSRAAQQHRGSGSCGSNSLSASKGDKGRGTDNRLGRESSKKRRTAESDNSCVSGAGDRDQGHPAGGSSSSNDEQLKSKHDTIPQKRKNTPSLIDETPKMKKSRKSFSTTELDTSSPCLDTNPFVKKLGKKELKPRLKAGDEVWAAWWADDESRRTNSTSSWYPGRIKDVEEVDRLGNEYGPTRYYDIDYDDGDALDGVVDMYVLPRSDYLLEDAHARRGRPGWLGVKNVVDEESSDGWARIIGWYTADIDGEVLPFSFLSEALRAYDFGVVRRKGSMTEPADLNLPEEWAFASRNNDVCPPRERAPPSHAYEDEKNNLIPAAEEVNTESKSGAQDAGSMTQPSDLNLPGERTLSSHKGKHASSDSIGSSHSTLVASFSDLKGFCVAKGKKAYNAQISHRGKVFHMGHYTLRSDAAFAHDKALRLLKDPSVKINGRTPITNFATDKQYTDLRAWELSRTSSKVDYEDTQAHISSLLSTLVTNVRAYEEDLDKDSGNDEGTKKQKKQKYAANEEVNAGSEPKAQDARSMTNPKELNFPEETHEGEHAPPGDRGSDDCVLGALFSKLKGCHFTKERTWRAQICHKGKQHHIGGKFKLKSDAAFAYDQALRLLNNSSMRIDGRVPMPNFMVDNQYTDLRDWELSRTCLSVEFEDTQSYISSCLDALAAKASACKQDFGEDNESDGKRKSKNTMNSAAAEEADAQAESKMQDIALSKVKRKKKSSVYAGVSYDKCSNSWNSFITSGDARINIASYVLETDAALLRDVATRLVMGQEDEPNFATLQDYERAKKHELEGLVLGNDFTASSEEIESKVKHILFKYSASANHTVDDIPSLELKALNDAIAKKWSAYLPTTTGPMYLADYQTGINEILRVPRQSKIDDTLLPSNLHADDGLSNVTASEKSSGNVTTLEIDKSHVTGTAVAPLLEPTKTSKESSGQKSCAQLPFQTSTSEKSQTVSGEAFVSLENLLTPSNVNTKKKTDFIEFTDHQIKQMTLPFNKGSAVWFNFKEINNSNERQGNYDKQEQSFCTGLVTAVCLDNSTRDILYQVKLDRVDRTEMLTKQKLCYAPSTAVNITMSSGIHLPGEVLMCSKVPGAKYDQDTIIQSVMQLRESLIKAKYQSDTHDCDRKLLALLSDLCQIDMNRHILAKTGIGKCVNKLSKSGSSSTVTSKACKLLQQWMEKAKVEKKLTSSHIHKPCVYSYTILVLKEGNHFQVEENVLSNRVTCRKGTHMSALENVSSASTISTATNADADQLLLLNDEKDRIDAMDKTIS